MNLKILCLGPDKTGKTVICNVLADNGLANFGEYVPTPSLRIVELTENVMVKGRQHEAEVQLWDCSGNPGCDSMWPAFVSKADGVLIVTNGEASATKNDRMIKLFNYFVRGRSLSKVCVLNNLIPGLPSDIKLLDERIEPVAVDAQQEQDELRATFKTFLESVVTTVLEDEDREGSK